MSSISRKSSARHDSPLLILLSANWARRRTRMVTNSNHVYLVENRGCWLSGRKRRETGLLFPPTKKEGKLYIRSEDLRLKSSIRGEFIETVSNPTKGPAGHCHFLCLDLLAMISRRLTQTSFPPGLVRQLKGNIPPGQIISQFQKFNSEVTQSTLLRPPMVKLIWIKAGRRKDFNLEWTAFMLIYEIAPPSMKTWW